VVATDAMLKKASSVIVLGSAGMDKQSFEILLTKVGLSSASECKYYLQLPAQRKEWLN